jgi:hypothetical protein
MMPIITHHASDVKTSGPRTPFIRQIGVIRGSVTAGLCRLSAGRTERLRDATNGETINTAVSEYCPMVTPDGRYLFFSRRSPGSWAEASEGNVYWVDARVLEQFRR